MRKYILIAVLAAMGLFTSPVFAQTPGAAPMGKGEPAKGDPMKKAAMSDGEVRKIDKEQGKITLKHGELPSLGMPSMTMVFKVKTRQCLTSSTSATAFNSLPIASTGL